MTAWHDQPPLSRREARQNQRNAESPVAQLSGEVPAFPDIPREGWEKDARGSQATPSQESRSRPRGRRAHREFPQPVPPIAEPLEYQTQGRPQVPSYDGPSFRNGSVSAAPEQSEAPVSEPSEVLHQGYRVRDFSPEGRRSTFSSTTPETPGSAPLEYHTQGVPIPLPVSHVDPVPPAPVEQQAPREQTISRRELRALRQAKEAAEAPIAEAEEVAFDPESHAVDAVGEEAEAEASVPVAAVPAIELPVPAAAIPVVEQPAPPEISPREEAPATVADPRPAADALQAPNPYTPPVGHWSTQAEIDDGEQFPESTLSRNVAVTGGAITTNALVMPSVPSVDVLQALGSTGEILITGTIDLPPGLGSTGARSGRYEKSDVDAIIEAADHDESSPDSAPVRAIRAVSTRSSARGVIQTKKPKSFTRLPVVLAVAAAAMAVGVVVLFVAGMIFKIF